jgi:hypothetical protein
MSVTWIGWAREPGRPWKDVASYPNDLTGVARRMREWLWEHPGDETVILPKGERPGDVEAAPLRRGAAPALRPARKGG